MKIIQRGKKKKAVFFVLKHKLKLHLLHNQQEIATDTKKYKSARLTMPTMKFYLITTEQYNNTHMEEGKQITVQR